MAALCHIINNPQKEPLLFISAHLFLRRLLGEEREKSNLNRSELNDKTNAISLWEDEEEVEKGVFEGEGESVLLARQ